MADDHSFPNAPHPTEAFEQVRDPPAEPEIDSEQTPDIEEPSALVIERHLTPGGELEEVVHREIDDRARASIRAAQQRYRDGVDEADQPLTVEPAGDYATRMRDRFHAAHNRDHEFDHDR